MNAYLNNSNNTEVLTTEAQQEGLFSISVSKTNVQPNAFEYCFATREQPFSFEILVHVICKSSLEKQEI